jgi:hypothetical protein
MPVNEGVPMTTMRWQPPQATSKQEEILLKRLRRTRKLFAFLRDCRHELFDEGFQAELETMYRGSGAGSAPVAPALLAMALILQGYLGASDAEAVELTVVDLRWQMVLDRLGANEAAFAQRTLVDFRNRLIATDMDRRLLERTIEFARRTKAFDWKKLPKDLRIAIDSSPLRGAGRVEDTINLLAHAARKVVECAATLLERSFDKVASDGGIPLLLDSSVKRALDIDWSDPIAQSQAVDELVGQIDSLEIFLRKKLPAEMKEPPLKEHLETLAQIRSQDLEPDPSGGGGVKIREGVAPDRRVSIEDADMRHGRKSSSKLFNGYKRHVATDLDTGLILACTVMPANKGEGEAAPVLKDDIARQIRRIAELHCDRGYIASTAVSEVIAQGGEILCKPWTPHNTKNKQLFTKADFKINLRIMTITCPAGETEDIVLGSNAVFDANACGSCGLRQQCTTVKGPHGRSVQISEDEHLQARLRKLQGSETGRERLRERTAVEHSLAHLSQRQGNRARYRGTRKNIFDVRRAAAIQNLEIVDRRLKVA